MLRMTLERRKQVNNNDHPPHFLKIHVEETQHGTNQLNPFSLQMSKQNLHCKCHHHQKQGANPTWALPGWVGGTKPGEDNGIFTSATFQLVFVLRFVRLDQFAFVH